MSRELLSEATSIHEGPVPAYLLDQIARQVGAQDGSTEKIAEFLLNRTAKSNMNVKLKAMQVINHCLKGGDPAFHHYMRLNEHAVRVLSNFQGSMDPAYGDEKNRRLRMAALETLNYLGVPASLNNNSGGPSSSFTAQPYASNPSSPPQSSTSWGGPAQPPPPSSQWGNAPPAPQSSAQSGGFGSNHGPSNGPWGCNPSGPSQFGAPPAPYRDSPSSAPQYGNGPPPSQYSSPQHGNPQPPQYGGPSQSTQLGRSSSHESSWRGASAGLVGGGLAPAPKNTTGGVWSSAGYEKKEPTAQEMIPTRWNSARDNRPTVLIGAKTSLFGAPKPVQPGVGGGNGGVHRMPSHMHHGSSSSGFGNSGTFNPPSVPPSMGFGGAPTGPPGHRTGISALSQPVADRPKSSIEQTLDDVKKKGFQLKDMWDRRNMDRSMASSLAEHDDYVNRNAALDARGQTYQPQPPTGSSDKSGEYERSLIDDLCPPGGLARAPPAENLNRFVDLAKSLDMNILGDLLLDKLEDDSWQVRLKGLCVWEALLDAPGCEHYAEWLEENVELLQHVAQDPKTAVAIKAKRVLQLIGVDAASHQPVAKPHQHSHEQRPHASVDLLAMNDLTLSGPSVPPPAQQPFHQQQQQQQQQQQVAPANLLDLSFSPLKNAAPTPTTTALDPLSLNAQPSLLLSPPRQLPPEASRHLGDFGKDLFTLANSPRNAAQPSPAPPPTEKSAFSFM
ncbi:hypothetical protein H310_11418 [Aphanomyces invadans]|uniref:ENTH domain-containing protein n=1 Tax=Aphanomyces invadans TaxID=157072 RepID=A0A024TP54_9STRA|nr:hypothetical protein H310_11418 [Aphanomyces invadans]ETV95152.1 hypothetical protein H310_11418 [Aphanomyces invadans]|eukprot:XP_008876325.1 hypothetical protein H310_11418 [Aphanomyces invadans]